MEPEVEKKVRLFRHGEALGVLYWMELLGDEQVWRIQRISLRGVGEFRLPFGPSFIPAPIDELVEKGHRYAAECVTPRQGLSHTLGEVTGSCEDQAILP